MMFDIVTIEPEDEIVARAIAVIVGRKALIQAPKTGHRLIAVNACSIAGDGGEDEHVLAVVGHAGPDTLSGEKTWANFVEQVTAEVDPSWTKNKKTIYLIACSTADSGTKFAYGNIANEIKAKFPNATVWASSRAVSASDLTGEWAMV